MRPVVNLQGVALPFTWKRENIAFWDELEESCFHLAFLKEKLVC